jgi:carboxylesterase
MTATLALGQDRSGASPGAASPPVLLLHGLTGAPADLQVVTKHLRRSGYAVEAPMLPGHGVDEAGLLKTGWRDWLEAAEQNLLRLTADGAPAVVGGLSMGAVLALALAARHPDRVRGVLCFSATLRYDGWVVPRSACFIPLLAHLPVLNRYRFKERPPYGIKDERLRAKMEEMLLSGALAEAGLPYMPARSLAQNLRLIRRVKRDLHLIAAPMLVVHAREDDITHIRNVEAMAASVKGPVTTLYLEDSYHLVTVDQERAQVARAAKAFLDGLHGAGPKASSAAPALRALEPA